MDKTPAHPLNIEYLYNLHFTRLFPDKHISNNMTNTRYKKWRMLFNGSYVYSVYFDEFLVLLVLHKVISISKAYRLMDMRYSIDSSNKELQIHL